MSRSGDGELSIQQAAAMARQFFVSFSLLQIGAILLVGPALAAGTIATERERRTIEYLFATDLSNSEIVLGKLCTRLLLLAYLVAVGLPILAIFGLLGGIHYQLVAFTFVVSASTMVLVASLATCISVWSPRARDAITRVYLILLVLLVLPIPIQAWLSVYGGMILIRSMTEAILTINPIWILVSELAPVGRGAGIAWRPLFILVAGQLTIAVASMFLATVAVRRVHLRSSGKGVRSKRWSRAFRRPAIGNRPMLWKEAFARQASAKLGVMGRLAAAILIIAILVGTGLQIYDVMSNARSKQEQLMQYSRFGLVAGDVLACSILILVAFRAASSVTGEKERQSWESLLTTPMSARNIVLAKIFGSIYQARWLFGLLAIVWGAGMLFDPGFIVPLVFLVAVLAVLAVVASSVGLLYSLWCTSTLRAAGATLATLLFAGGGYFFCCAPVMIALGPNQSTEIFLAPCIPFLLAFPGFLYIDPHGLNDSQVAGAYILGALGYTFAAFFLPISAVSRFDSLTGRVGWRRGKPGKWWNDE